jgi:predicted dehydrogenase
MRRWRVAGINFDHMHMGDLLRMASEHPEAEIVGICDEQPGRMDAVRQKLTIAGDRVFTDERECVERTKPDVVILCPATGRHAEWTERVAPLGVHILMEKPFAANLAEADRMIAAVRKTGKQLAINWPLRWRAPHVMAKRLIEEGVIGEVIEVHYYGGNRGPLRHLADKVEVSEAEATRRKNESWFYRKSEGGGSLLDYLGYGVTIGSWFNGAKVPIEMTCIVDRPAGLEVDEHSVTVARYETGLSKYETRWGTFTDPWMLQPQPKCGFVIVGTGGTIGSFDYDTAVWVQTQEKPEGFEVKAEPLQAPFQNPVQYFLDCLEKGKAVEGPLSPALSRLGQRMVDAAVRSATERRTVPLMD